MIALDDKKTLAALEPVMKTISTTRRRFADDYRLA